MGLQIGELVSRKEVSFSELKGKTIAVDAYNVIYQFLSSVRQPDGTPLMDSSGAITSHLSGLFYRNVALMLEGINLIYVFDGEYNVLKGKTHALRKAAKEIMAEKYEEAMEDEDIEQMGKYAKGLSRLDKQMIEESKELLEAMGVAVVQAPGEGEMQAAELVKNGQAWAVGSQDYDALVVGATRLIQNLTLSRKRKTSSGFVYIAPEMIEFDMVINQLGITWDQLICLSILVGTDFNPGGVRGIGPKKALALVKQFVYPVKIFENVVERHGDLGFNWREIFEIFKKPDVSKHKVNYPKFNEDKIKEILVSRHEFSAERIENYIAKLRELKAKKAQTSLF